MAEARENVFENTTALIVGAGSGLSASLARAFAGAGMKIALAARSIDDLSALVGEVKGKAFVCDAVKHDEVVKLFANVTDAIGDPEVVVYNASYRVRGPLIEIDPAEVEKSLAVSAFGGFLVGQEAARRMVPRRRGTILLTGASASVKGYAQSASFAMGKFALRGLAQSMARELGPQGIHVAHFIIDGGIESERRRPEQPDSMLHPDAIAATYLAVLRQDRSAWSFEVDLRPWVEKF